MYNCKLRIPLQNYNRFLVHYLKIFYILMDPKINLQPLFHILILCSKDRSSIELLLQTYLSKLKSNSQLKVYVPQRYDSAFDGIEILNQQTKIQVYKKLSCIVVIGDNQALMDAVSQFYFRDTPPILGIGNGSALGLYNYLYYQLEEKVVGTVKRIMENSLQASSLMKIAVRLNCDSIAQAMSQIEIHRAMDQPIVILNIFIEIENSCKLKIGQFRGDGILISTPMGSYCKSMSLNGPLMCKTMENILITPICPLSMKFRPICLPASSVIFIEVDPGCRTNYANIYVDDRNQGFCIKKNELLRVKMSKYKAKLVTNIDESEQISFVTGLKHAIRWGENYNEIHNNQNLGHIKLLQKMSFN